MKEKIKNSNGITLIALIITIIILVILAAVSIRAVTNMGIVGHAINGTQQYAEQAKAENAMFDETGRRIEDAVAKVKEIQGNNSTSDSLKLTYTLNGTTLKVFIYANEYDKDYYNFLTEKVLKNAKDWDGLDFDTIAELSQHAIEHEWGNKKTHNSLKEWYLEEYSDKYKSCAAWAYDWLEELTSEEKDEALALLPSKPYYITITYDGETRTINLANTSCAEFELDVEEDTIYGIDNQNNSKANVTIIPTFSIDNEVYQYVKGWTWAQWIESEYNLKGFVISQWRYPNGKLGGDICGPEGTIVTTNEQLAVYSSDPIDQNLVYNEGNW